ncbi:MAG: AbrB/MazE/SpoVT family DNA-binding domain-containing protein [Candidatus Njordarchaeia archaeon]
MNKKNVSKIDENGRVYIPKKLREILGLKPGDLVEIDVNDRFIIIKRMESIAKMGKGAFKPIKNVGEDIDSLIEKLSFLDAMEN